MVDHSAAAQRLIEEAKALQAEQKRLAGKWLRTPNSKKRELQVSSRLSKIRVEADELATQPLSDLTTLALVELARRKSPGADKAKWLAEIRDRRQELARLPDLSSTTLRTNKTGSRSDKDYGYFAANDQYRGRVVLFRGYEGVGEQTKLLAALRSLDEQTPQLRSFLPTMYGTATIDGNLYLVMEDLTASGKKGTDLASGLSKEGFLQQYGAFLTDSFRHNIEKFGLNLGRHTLEKDYLFVEANGRIRWGIPFRAADFVRALPDMLRMAAPAATDIAAAPLSPNRSTLPAKMPAADKAYG